LEASIEALGLYVLGSSWVTNYSAEDAVQLLLEKRPSLRPWHNCPYVLEALWKLEGLRTEWHMELSAAGGN